MLHLLIGNATIGVLEGLALGWLFRVSLGRAIGAMVIANYISAWTGAL